MSSFGNFIGECTMAVAVSIVAFAWPAEAATFYQNTTTQVGAFEFNGATQEGPNLEANVDINQLTLAPGSNGMAIASLSFLADNFNAVSVQARPTIYVWAADGAGGNPGTLLGDFVLPLETLSPGVQTLTYVLTGPTLIVPANMQIWVGIGFDNDNGASPITAAELNALGGNTYHPATIGMDAAQAYFLPPSSGAGVSSPGVIAFGAAYGANYGWTVTTTSVPVTPAPPSVYLTLLGLAGVGFYLARSRPGLVKAP